MSDRKQLRKFKVTKLFLGDGLRDSLELNLLLEGRGLSLPTPPTQPLPTENNLDAAGSDGTFKLLPLDLPSAPDQGDLDGSPANDGTLESTEKLIKYMVSIEIPADRPGLLGTVTGTISSKDINIANIRAGGLKSRGPNHAYIAFAIKLTENQLFRWLKCIDELHKLERAGGWTLKLKRLGL